MKKLKELSKYIIIIALILVILVFANYLLVPKYMGGVREGAMTAEYYDNAGNNQVVFVGDCEVYENFSPITLWEEYGITSYIRGSAQQLIWQSYYLLEEVFEYEKPKVVVFNVLSMKYNEPQKEEYNRMTLDGMKMSPIKIEAIKASMTEEEELITYIFPLLRYHSRWSNLTGDDFKYLFTRDKIAHNGYLMRADVTPVEGLAEYIDAENAAGNTEVKLNYDELYNIGFVAPKRYNSTMDFGENAYKYLDMMRELCEKNGAELVLIKSPSIYPYWYEQWDEAIEKYAADYDLKYINMLDYLNDMGIDYCTDTYDKGLHMNLSGAEKASKWFGKYLKENFELTDYRENKEISEDWQEKIDFYFDMKADQEEKLEKYGYLKGYVLEE